MGSYNEWELQKAIETRLGNDAATSGYTVTDNKDADYPYIAIGAGSDVERSTADTDGSNSVPSIHVWATNTKKCKEMMADIDTALKRSRLSVSGSKQLRVPMRVNSEVRDDFDGSSNTELRHGIIDYEFMLANT